MKTLPADLVRLEDVADLDQDQVIAWNCDHLNPGLISLMRLGGYDRVQIVRAEGAFMYTRDGRALLDLVSSYGALNHGHNHPRVVRASRWFDERGDVDLCKEFPSPYAAALAHNLTVLTPGDLKAVFFCNSGTEAVEGALKLTQRYFGGERGRFVYAENSLHGKTFGSLSVTGREKYREHVRRFEDWPMVPFGDAAALEAVFEADHRRQIAGLVLEPIQGEGGVVVPPRGYLQRAAEICKRHGALLILDEIQTAFGRTGSMFRCEAEGVVPDVLCLAKSLGGGVAAIGATVTRPDIQAQAYGGVRDCLVHTSTFGGRARAAAVALEALNVLVDEELPARAAETGAWLIEELEAVRRKHPKLIRSVRGEGLMIGVELHPVRAGSLLTRFGLSGLEELVEALVPGMIGAELLQHHDIVASFVLNDPHVLRVYPALVASREDLAVVPRALDAVLSKGLLRIVSERIAYAAKHVGLGSLREWARRA